MPIAIPLIARPSTFATLLLLVSREPGRRLDWLMALLLAWTVTAVILLASTGLHRLLGERGLTAHRAFDGNVAGHHGRPDVSRWSS